MLNRSCLSYAATVSATYFLAFLAHLLLPAPVHGQGFRNLDQGASATAQGAAFAAQADDPSALHYNPAGMTQLPGLQLSVGTSLFSARTTFTGLDGATVRGGTPGLVANPPPSNFYLTATLRDVGVPALGDLTVGLGVTSPFGLLAEYPSSGPLSTVSTYAALPLLDIKPTLAYKLNDYLSIGAGVDIYTFFSWVGDGHAELKLNAGPEFGPLGIPTGTRLEANGTDTAVGFNLSALVTPLRNASGKPRLNLGLVYRSPVDLDLKGDFLTDGVRVAGAEIPVKLPWTLTGAIAGWPVRDEQHEWKLEVDVDYVDWTSFRNSNLTLSGGTTVPFPRDWGTSWVVMFGTEFRWLRLPSLAGWEVAARAGYIHATTPVPERTFEPVVPDTDYNAFSIGVGFLCRRPGSFLGVLPCGKALGLDLAYQAVLHDSRRISDNIDPRVIGRWETTLHVGAINLRVQF